ncbi:UNVERIFIED_CONTAM: hypothetical protein Slati_0135100 [Sesamum latifolium]|uniref:Uncharacterized protein n=1 Tax=Sesamum latifolium TaxID=2727402 RepID=A0AAW2Y9M5_9LAMI
MRGVLSSSDRQLLAPLSREELEGIASSFLLKVSSMGFLLVRSFFLGARGAPSMPQREAKWRKLEDKVNCLNADVAKIKEEKKEVVTCNQQQDKE